MEVFFDNENKSHIDTLVTEFAYSTFGSDFVFRSGQKEQCIDIIYHFVSKKDTVKRRYVLQAPTGSGKSIIAIIVAGVLSNVYKMRGYILVSDLGLLNQYIQDVKEYCKNWAYIKGKTNYTCLVNGRNYLLGECHTHDMTCKYNNVCPYVYANFRAENAEVVVCTYHYWLIHKNIDNHSNREGDEKRNEFIICDEAHNMMTIVQNMYSLSIGEVYVNHAKALDDMFPETLGTYKLMNNMGKYVTRLIDACYKQDIEDIYGCVSELKVFIEDVYAKLKSMSKSSSMNSKISNLVSKHILDAKYYRELMWFRNAKEKLDTYNMAIKGRADKIIATLSENKKNAILNSTDESYLMDCYVHSNYTRGLFMSATIGNMNEFSKDLNIDDSELECSSVSSTFDFTNSKIFYCPTYSLSRNTLEQNFPAVVKMTNAVLDKFIEYRGCIFVSSYEMAAALYNSLSEDNQKRIMIYKDAKEKSAALVRLKESLNGVLIGPSIFEGISLDDDLCRFSIIAKVPYADTSNKLVKYKLDKFGFGRYAMSAIQNIIQAVGRGMRNETDWCTTFILDGAFSNLYNNYRNSFDKTFIDRVVPVSMRDIIL